MTFDHLAVWAASDQASLVFAATALAVVLGAAVLATLLAPPAPSDLGPGAAGPTPWIVRFYAFAVVAFGVLISLAFLVTIAPPIGRMLLGAESPADALGAFFTTWGPVSVLLAGLVGALSLPLIIYRADVATKQARASEKLALDAIRKSDLQERDMAERAKAAARDVAQREAAATKTDVSERTLRATELLGAIVERERRETVSETVVVDGKPQKSLREVFVTTREPNIEVRLGAIYALERVAKEDVEASHWPIVQTMLAYIRKRRGAPDEIWEPFFEEHGEAPEPAPDDQATSEEGGGPHNPKKAREPAPLAQWRAARLAYIAGGDFAAVAREDLPEDVAAAIGVLRRRSAAQLAAELGAPPEETPLAHQADGSGRALFKHRMPRRPFELSQTPLYGADLRDVDWRRQALIGARLEGARLVGARLEGANIRRAQLQGADLRRADLTAAHMFQVGLEGASLKVARLERAHLVYARLDGASLAGAKARNAEFARAALRGADLASAQLGQADFTKADLTEARLDQAMADGATLAGAVLTGARCERTHLARAALVGADLRRANLLQARLDDADLFEADLTGADLRGARLDGASFAGATLVGVQNLTQTQLDACFGDAAAAAALSALGLSAPAHWAGAALDRRAAAAACSDWRAGRAAPAQ